MSLYDDGIDHTVCEAATTTTTNTTATPATPIEPSDSLAESSSLVVDFQPGFSSFQAAPEIEYHRERIENGGATLTPPIMSSSSSSSSSEQEKGVLVGVNYISSRLHVSAGSGTAAAPEPANQAQAIKNLPWPIWRMPASGEEQANEEGAPPSIEKTPKHTEDAAKKVFPDTTSLAQAADKTQAKTSSKMWIFKAPTKPRSHLFLDLMSLVVSDIMFFVAVLAMYMVSTPEKGGLEIPLSAVGTCIMMAGLMLTLLSPLCGAYLDRTQRYQVIMATSFVLTIFVWVGLILNTVVAVFAVLIATYGALFSFYQPGLNSLSAGIAGSEAVTQRFARNELFKHLGTVLYAVLILVVFGRDGVTIADEMGVDTETETAWDLNQYQTYFCFVMGFLAFASLVVMFGIKKSDIDLKSAVGDSGQEDEEEAVQEVAYEPKSLKEILMERKDIRYVLMSMVLFHLANAALLPHTAIKIEEILEDNEGKDCRLLGFPIDMDGITALGITVIIAQSTMTFASIPAGMLAKVKAVGTRNTTALGFVLLPIRCCILALSENYEILTIVGGILMGVSEAILGVLGMVMLMDLSKGTGRASTFQGLLVTMIGFGSALSQALAGFLSHSFGVNTTFITMGVISLVGLFALSLVSKHPGKGPTGDSFSDEPLKKPLLINRVLFSEPATIN